MTDVNSLAASKSGFDWHAEKFERNKAQLFRPDGTPKYSPQEHNERMASLLEPVTTAAQHVKEAAAAAIEEAKTAKAIEHADPLSSLSNDELQRAASLRGFVEDYVNSTSLDKVAQRMAAVVASGHKAEIAVYHQAVTKRVGELERAAAAGGNRTMLLANIPTVAPVLETMSQKLADPAIAKQLAAAKELEQVAYNVRSATINKLAELDGTNARFSASLRAL